MNVWHWNSTWQFTKLLAFFASRETSEVQSTQMNSVGSTKQVMFFRWDLERLSWRSTGSNLTKENTMKNRQLTSAKVIWHLIRHKLYVLQLSTLRFCAALCWNWFVVIHKYQFWASSQFRIQCCHTGSLKLVLIRVSISWKLVNSTNIKASCWPLPPCRQKPSLLAQHQSCPCGSFTSF